MGIQQQQKRTHGVVGTKVALWSPVVSAKQARLTTGLNARLALDSSRADSFSLFQSRRKTFLFDKADNWDQHRILPVKLLLAETMRELFYLNVKGSYPECIQSDCHFSFWSVLCIFCVVMQRCNCKCLRNVFPWQVGSNATKWEARSQAH